jgi:hypothetical protein
LFIGCEIVEAAGHIKTLSCIYAYIWIYVKGRRHKREREKKYIRIQ